MSKKYGFVVTDDCRELIAKLVAGQKLKLSRVMVGSGTVEENVEAILQLIRERGLSV